MTDITKHAKWAFELAVRPQRLTPGCRISATAARPTTASRTGTPLVQSAESIWRNNVKDNHKQHRE